MTRIRALHLTAITVASAVDGDKKDAKLFRCQCGSDKWVVFEIIGQNHPHLQCSACHEVYCSRLGGCHAPPTETRPAPSPDVVERIARMVETVARDEREIGVFSTSEQIAVALVLDRKDLMPRGYDTGTWIEAVDRLGEKWFEAARAVQRLRDLI